jgi:hypothetical protein
MKQGIVTPTGIEYSPKRRIFINSERWLLRKVPSSTRSPLGATRLVLSLDWPVGDAEEGRSPQVRKNDLQQKPILIFLQNSRSLGKIKMPVGESDALFHAAGISRNSAGKPPRQALPANQKQLSNLGWTLLEKSLIENFML